jgi:hypothetical protein
MQKTICHKNEALRLMLPQTNYIVHFAKMTIIQSSNAMNLQN